MYQSLKIFSLFIAFSFGTYTISKKALAQETPVSFQVFYDELSPYGQWVDHPSYGYVWLPAVDPGFSPYATAGHWIFTDFGWTWVSDYPWGWAPFHYGRWNYDNSYGWFWVPQNEWGPAWVVWRQSNDYYGWAPMGYGVSISVAFGSGYNVPYDHWRFVRARDFNRTNINNYYVDRSTNVTIINNSTVIQNTHVDEGRHTTYVYGPRRDDVQKVSDTPIRTVAVRENTKPGQNLKANELEIYRPQIQPTETSGQKVAPRKVIKMEELKPTQQRGTENNTSQPIVPGKNEIKEQPTRQAAPVKQNEGQPVQEKKSEQRMPKPFIPNNNEIKELPAQPAPTKQNVPKPTPENKTRIQEQPMDNPDKNNMKKQPAPANQNTPIPERRSENQQQPIAPPKNVTPAPVQQMPQAQPNPNNRGRNNPVPVPNNNRPAPQQARPQQNNPQPNIRPQDNQEAPQKRREN